MVSEFKFDCDAYLERIAVSDPVSLSIDFLEQIHRAHAYTIPFENFDIMLGRGIDLSPGKLFDKIILQSRGGYCFELNGLFLQLIQTIGFQAVPLLARVQTRGTPTGRHHQLSLVNINGKKWIADIGFGANGLRAPIPFVMNSPSGHDGLLFRLVEAPPFGTMLQIMEDEEWNNLYSFDLEYVCNADIDSGNHFTSTSPDSYFTWMPVAALPNQTGRVALANFQLTVYTDDGVEIIELEPGEIYMQIIKEYFGIVIDEPYENIRPLNPNPNE